MDFQYDFALGVSDNGNVNKISNNRNTGRNVTYAYDTLNRIKSAITDGTSGSTCWAQLFGSMVNGNYVSGYDSWGNLLTITPDPSRPSCSVNTLSQAADLTNRITGYCYDTAGNLLAQSAPPCPAPTYSYNAENQLVTAVGVAYVYDGDGKRVKKSSGKLYWYGSGSDALDETDLSGNTNNATFEEYVFFTGKRIARRDSSGNISYYFADHLGTTRVVANSTGTVLDDSDFYPFGGERVILSSSGNNYKFTGKERDPESNLDEFGARYYASALGRFTIPDWAVKPTSVPFANFGNPQSLNLYSYVQNNPTTLADLDGHEVPAPYCSRVSQAQCEAAMREEAAHPIRSALLPPIALGGWVSGAIFAPGAVGAALVRFAPLLTAAGAALQSARDSVTEAIEGLKDVSSSAVTNSRVGSALNALKDHANDMDLKGVIREGEGVIKGAHFDELQSVVNSLSNIKSSIQGALSNPNLSDEARASYTQALIQINNFISTAQPMIEKARRMQTLMQMSQTPQ